MVDWTLIPFEGDGLYDSNEITPRCDVCGTVLLSEDEAETHEANCCRTEPVDDQPAEDEFKEPEEPTYEESHPHEYANELEYDQREAEQTAKAHEDMEKEDY